MSPLKITRKKPKTAPELETKTAVIRASSKESWKILKRPHLSEKAVDLNRFNKYVFLTDVSANKSEIKKEIERRYAVRVIRVNLLNIKGKIKRFGNKFGGVPSVKKAIVTLKAGQKIEIGT